MDMGCESPLYVLCISYEGGVVLFDEIENGLALLKAEMKVRNCDRVTMQFI